MRGPQMRPKASDYLITKLEISVPARIAELGTY